MAESKFSTAIQCARAIGQIFGICMHMQIYECTSGYTAPTPSVVTFINILSTLFVNIAVC